MPSTVYDFKTPEEWREWLEKNHSIASEAYVVHYKKQSKKEGLRYSEALEEALCFGWIDGVLKSLDEDKFVLRYTPRKSKSPWSLINKKKALDLIKRGKMTDAGLKKISEAKKNGMWRQAYTNKVVEVLPEDLAKELRKRKGAYEKFMKLSPSHKNQYIGWVNEAKKIETREKRIQKTVENLLILPKS